MPFNRFLISFLVGWSAVVFTTLTARFAWLHSSLSVSEYAVWLLLASGPVAVSLILARGRAVDTPSPGLDTPTAQQAKGAQARETLTDLYELVESIAHRVPDVERVGEPQHMRDAGVHSAAKL